MQAMPTNMLNFTKNKKYNCSGPQASKVKELDISLTKIITSLSTFKKSAQFITSFLRKTDFRAS